MTIDRASSLYFLIFNGLSGKMASKVEEIVKDLVEDGLSLHLWLSPSSTNTFTNISSL